MEGNEMSEADLIERLLHPKYVELIRGAGDDGWVLDPVSVRRDLTLAAQEIEKLKSDLLYVQTGGELGKRVSGHVGGNGGGVSSLNFCGSGGSAKGGGPGVGATASGGAQGGRGGGGGVNHEGLRITDIKVGGLTPEVLEASLIHPRDVVDDGHINYVILASGDDGKSRKDNGLAMTWGGCIKMIAEGLQKWIDKDGFNVRIIAISATRDPVEHKRTGPV